MSAPGRPYLTPRQRAVLDFIGLHVAYQGYPPTYREIGDACGLTSVRRIRVLGLRKILIKIGEEPSTDPATHAKDIYVYEVAR